MVRIYKSNWVLPVSSFPISNGAIAIDGESIVAVGSESEILAQYQSAEIVSLGNAVLLPGLVNTHTHLELTVMRGYLESEEQNFFGWLRKLTIARRELMTPDDILVSATWGACEAVRAGVTCVGDASDSAAMSMDALRQVGLRGTVFQESFGPDPNLAKENFDELRTKVIKLRELETGKVRVGVSPHSPYTVSGPQLELIAQYAKDEKLPLMMHAAESEAENLFVREGTGLFADGLARRDIQWQAEHKSPIQYLNERQILSTRPLLAHCIRVDEEDIETLVGARASVAHCPKSNAKLGHGRAPLGRFLKRGLTIGLGSDSVASNNTCDILEEARFAALMSRIDSEGSWPTAQEMIQLVCSGGAKCLRLEHQIGQLAVGRQADFIAVSLNGIQQQPCYEPEAGLIFSSSGRDVILTVIAGQEVYRNNEITTVDENRLRARLNEIREKVQNTVA